MGKIDLKSLFLGLQKQLETSLQVNRQYLPHPSTKGDATELDWIGMLRQYLPSRYQVEKAFALDVNGNLSEQQDIIIFDRHYCPLLLNHNGAIYVPAESIYAVLEVKQTLNKEHIEYAGSKAKSVRSLHRTSAPIPYSDGVRPPKPPFKILAGILTLDSEWKPAFGAPFMSALSALPDDEHLDLGCSLLDGAFDAIYMSDHLPYLTMSDATSSLVFFFLHLLHHLQQVGTVPAIDLEQYISVLNKDNTN